MAYNLTLPNGEHVTDDDDCCLTIVYKIEEEHAITPDQVSRFRVRRSQSMKYYVEVINPNIKDLDGCTLSKDFLYTIPSWEVFYDVIFELLTICASADYVTGTGEDDGPFDSLQVTLPSYLYIQRHYAGTWMPEFPRTYLK